MLRTRKRTKRAAWPRRIATTLVLLSVLFLLGCGGSKDEPEPRTDWDEIVWDDDRWS